MTCRIFSEERQLDLLLELPEVRFELGRLASELSPCETGPASSQLPGRFWLRRLRGSRPRGSRALGTWGRCPATSPPGNGRLSLRINMFSASGCDSVEKAFFFLVYRNAAFKVKKG